MSWACSSLTAWGADSGKPWSSISRVLPGRPSFVHISALFSVSGTEESVWTNPCSKLWCLLYIQGDLESSWKMCIAFNSTFPLMFRSMCVCVCACTFSLCSVNVRKMLTSVINILNFYTIIKLFWDLLMLKSLFKFEMELVFTKTYAFHLNRSRGIPWQA